MGFKKEWQIFVFAFIILIFSYLITKFNPNMSTGKIVERTMDFGAQPVYNLLFTKDKPSEEDFNILRQAIENPFFKLFNLGESKDEVRDELYEYQKYINRLQGEDLYFAIEQLYSYKDLIPSEFSDLLPSKINLNNFNILIIHGDEYNNEGDLVSTYRFFATANNKRYEIIIIGELKKGFPPFNFNGYLYFDKIYVNNNIKEPIQQNLKSTNNNLNSGSRVRTLPITGYPVYNPPTPFNQRPFDVAAFVPYDANHPLPSNYQSFLQPVLQNVVRYYRDISENNTNFNFTVYPIFLNPYVPDNIIDVINQADPFVNYALFDFVSIIMTTSCNFGYPTCGYASMSFYPNGTPRYYQTNEGPIPSAVPVISINFNQNVNYRTEKVIEHEIGHELTFWHPQENNTVHLGFVPHASGDPYCIPYGSVIVCDTYEYGDYLDVMGYGLGSFHYHARSFFMGLSPISRVRTITSSGIYSLCDIQHPPSLNCPQELLLENPIGINLALELNTHDGPELFYVCPQYFPGVAVRATDREEGGAMNNTLYYGPTEISGDVILPLSSLYTYCQNGLNIPDYLIKPGQTMNSKLGPISVLSITDSPTGGKQALVNISLIPPQCTAGPPTATASPYNLGIVDLFSNNLWTYVPPDYFINFTVNVRNNNACNTGSEIFSVRTEVPSIPGAIATTITQPIGSAQAGGSINLPIPSALQGLIGLYPAKLIVAKLSNPSHNYAVDFNFSLTHYDHQIVGPFTVSNCTDIDTSAFSFQNFGANFTSMYPNSGAIVTLNPPIPGIPPNTYVPDVCLNPKKVTDVICGSNIGIPGFENYAFLIVGDCRFVMNNQLAFCYNGYCR